MGARIPISGATTALMLRLAFHLPRRSAMGGGIDLISASSGLAVVAEGKWAAAGHGARVDGAE